MVLILFSPVIHEVTDVLCFNGVDALKSKWSEHISCKHSKFVWLIPIENSMFISSGLWCWLDIICALGLTTECYLHAYLLNQYLVTAINATFALYVGNKTCWSSVLDYESIKSFFEVIQDQIIWECINTQYLFVQVQQ